jgi:Protein of unknown function (DUF4238)
MVARRHHYVPKCYLNSFSIENDHKKNLLVFDAIDRKHFKTAADNVALERDFNTIDLEGHSPDAFEKAMACVESDIGPALTRIVGAKSLANENDRTLLLNLIGLLHIRNPRFRELKRAFQENVAKRVLALVLSSREIWEAQVKKAQEAGFIAKDAETDYDRMKASYKPENYKAALPVAEHLLSEMDTFDHALPLLFERKWVLMKAPEQSPGFITCDHPVCLTWSEPQNMRRPLGLKTKGTEILFPISPKLAVVGAFELDNGEADIDEEDVASAKARLF